MPLNRGKPQEKEVNDIPTLDDPQDVLGAQLRRMVDSLCDETVPIHVDVACVECFERRLDPDKTSQDKRPKSPHHNQEVDPTNSASVPEQAPKTVQEENAEASLETGAEADNIVFPLSDWDEDNPFVHTQYDERREYNERIEREQFERESILTIAERAVKAHRTLEILTSNTNARFLNLHLAKLIEQCQISEKVLIACVEAQSGGRTILGVSGVDLEAHTATIIEFLLAQLAECKRVSIAILAGKPAADIVDESLNVIAQEVNESLSKFINMLQDNNPAHEMSDTEEKCDSVLGEKGDKVPKTGVKGGRTPEDPEDRQAESSAFGDQADEYAESEADGTHTEDMDEWQAQIRAYGLPGQAKRAFCYR